MTDTVPPLLPPIYYGAQFQTRITTLTLASSAWTRALLADPRRVYVRFEAITGGGFGAKIVPGPLPVGLGVSPASNLPIEWKYHDCPSILMGEFYVSVTAIGSIIMYESLFIGV